MRSLLRKSQQVLSTTGYFIRFHLARTEHNQPRHKPFRAYQDPDRIVSYGDHWKRILFFFIRAQDAKSEELPKYRLSTNQRTALRRLLDLVSAFSTLAEFEATLAPAGQSDSASDQLDPTPPDDLEDAASRTSDTSDDSDDYEADSDSVADQPDPAIIRNSSQPPVEDLHHLEKACLEFCLSLICQKARQDEYELPMINALAVLGLQQNGFHDPSSYPSILSSILKISRFLVLQAAILDTPSPSSSGSAVTPPSSSSVSSSSGNSPSHATDSTPGEDGILHSNADADKILSRLGINVNGRSLVDKVSTLVDTYLVRKTDAPMQWVLDIRAYGMSIARTTTATGYLDWHRDTLTYGTISFSLPAFRSFVAGLVTSTRAGLFEDVLLQTNISSSRPRGSLPPIPWEKIKDNPLNSNPSFNFLQDDRTDMGLANPDRWLFDHIANSPPWASHFGRATVARGRFKWKNKEVLAWLSQISSFLEKLLLLFHLTGGQPARAPEILSVRAHNGINTGRRNVFFEDGLICFVTYYHKGYSTSNTLKIIHRYVPQEVGELLVYYLWLVLPLEERLYLHVHESPPSDFLFRNAAKAPPSNSPTAAPALNSDQFRRIFRRESALGLGQEVNPSCYRHIAIGIARRFLVKRLQFRSDEFDEEPDDDDDDDHETYEDGILDQQAGHSPETAGAVYARMILEPSGEVASRKSRFRDGSMVSIDLLPLPQNHIDGQMACCCPRTTPSSVADRTVSEEDGLIVVLGQQWALKLRVGSSTHRLESG